MAFSRNVMPPARPGTDALTADMAGIGMSFAAVPNPAANIEDTLVQACELGMEEDELRVLSVLTTWIEVHGSQINADRLVRVFAKLTSDRMRAYGTALGSLAGNDRRFARLSSAYEGPRVDLLRVGGVFQVSRRGEDKRFVGTALRVPQGVLRRRISDVMTPVALARLHPGYRNRLRMGPSWRADVWTVLEQDPEMSVAEVARRAYCSFATAWQVRRDFQILRASQGEIDAA